MSDAAPESGNGGCGRPAYTFRGMAEARKRSRESVLSFDSLRVRPR
jgi:hypothetical protein